MIPVGALSGRLATFGLQADGPRLISNSIHDSTVQRFNARDKLMHHPMSPRDGTKPWLWAAVSPLLLACFMNTRAAEPALLRAGMIGLDTSHVPAFAKLFNNPKATGDISGIRIV